jgi:VanZ family protein
LHLPTLTWASLVAVGLLFPGPPEDESQGIADWLPVLAHFATFSLLAFLVYRSLAGLRTIRSPVVATFALCFLYGLVLELIQKVVPGRGWELGDLFMNGLGIVVGLVAARGFVSSVGGGH